MAEADSFFSRWSRRKTALAQGQVPDEPPAPRPVLAPAPGPLSQATSPVSAATAGAMPSTPLQTAAEVPPLTLEDTHALTPESDFTPFMARGVAPQVKNAAMKKLFADPHYNVMDRLDIYIDDYAQPDPLPEAMLRKMASAKFLNLFDEGDPDVPPSGPAIGEAAAVAVAGEDANTQITSTLPQSEHPSFTPTAILQPLNPDDAHAHADLRLQPHHPSLDAQDTLPGSAAGPGGQ